MDATALFYRDFATVRDLHREFLELTPAEQPQYVDTISRELQRVFLSGQRLREGVILTEDYNVFINALEQLVSWQETYAAVRQAAPAPASASPPPHPAPQPAPAARPRAAASSSNGGGGSSSSSAPAPARARLQWETPHEGFESLLGMAAEKKLFETQVIGPLMHPDIAPSIPGILLYGPPGTGKTRLARAFGCELARALGGAPASFAYVRASDILGSLVGQSEAAIEQICIEAMGRGAANGARVVLFIDEGDSIFGCISETESSGVMGRVQGILRTYFDPDHAFGRHVLVVSATNWPDKYEPSFLRRFPCHIYVGLPNFEQRRAVFLKTLEQYGASAVPSADVDRWMRAGEGCSCAAVIHAANKATNQRLDRLRHKPLFVEIEPNRWLAVDSLDDVDVADPVALPSCTTDRGVAIDKELNPFIADDFAGIEAELARQRITDLSVYEHFSARSFK